MECDDLLNHDAAMRLGGATRQCLANRKAFYRHSPSRREKARGINGKNKSILHCDSGLTLARMKSAAVPTRQHNPGQVARAAPLIGLRAMRACFDFDCSHRWRTATSEVVGNGMMGGTPPPLFFKRMRRTGGGGTIFAKQNEQFPFVRRGHPLQCLEVRLGTFHAAPAKLRGRGFARVTSTIKIVR